MRSLLYLIVVGLIGFGVFRACKRATPDEGVESQPVASAADGTSTAPVESTSNAAAESTLPSEPIVQAVARLAATGALGDLEAEISRLEAEGNERDRALANRIRAAVDAKDAVKRWTALSRLTAEDWLSKERVEELSARAVGAAKEGVLKGSVARVRVVKGDSLVKICKRAAKDLQLSLTPGLLRWVNGIPGDRIKPDQELILPRGELRIVVSKPRFRIELWLGDGLLRAYPVALGRDDKTPVFDFVIESKLEKPPWDDPTTGKTLHYGEPGYALGTRWLAFNDAEGHAGLGIHGTDDPKSIGTNASLGCVRLRNEDVEELFELVPLKTKVSIRGS